MGYIVDMSKYQKDSFIDWVTFSRNVDLLFLRIQYGSSSPDPEYKNHASNAKKYGVPFHSYVFPCFNSVNDARVEARDGVSRQDGASLSICVDVEPEYDTNGNPKGITKLSQQVRLDGFKAYVDELRKQGVKMVGAYIDQRVYESWGINTILSIFDYIWIPSYGVDNGSPSKQPKYPSDLWQYTQKGKVPGYNGYLDLSAVNGSKPLGYFTAKQNLVPAKVESQPTHTASAPSEAKPLMTVKAIGAADIRALPDHSSGFIRNTSDGEIFNVWEIKNDWHRVAAYPEKNVFGWIDGNNGQNLYWLKNPNAQPSTPQQLYYVVKSGDTASKIASANGVAVQAIKDLNNLLDVNRIYAGQKLRLK